MARRVSEEDSMYLRGAAGCLLCGSVRGGLRYTVVLHHFPKASPILQADCMHYHILCVGHEKRKDVALLKRMCVHFSVRVRVKFQYVHYAYEMHCKYS